MRLEIEDPYPKKEPGLWFDHLKQWLAARGATAETERVAEKEWAATVTAGGHVRRKTGRTPLDALYAAGMAWEEDRRPGGCLPDTIINPREPR